MKYIILLLLLSLQAYASDLTALVRIEKDNGLFYVIRAENGDRIPVIPDSPEVKAMLDTLSTGNDAIMKGHVTYIKNIEPHTLSPVFVIEEIKKVSLKDLSVDYKAEALPPAQITSQEIILRPSFPVTTQVASAITLTTSFLLMENLTSGDTDPAGRRQINQALFFSAGAMATLLFIYDQIQGKTKL